MNNIALGLFLAAEGNLSASTGSANAGNAEWLSVPGTVVVMLVDAWIVVRLHRRMGLARTTPPDLAVLTEGD